MWHVLHVHVHVHVTNFFSLGLLISVALCKMQGQVGGVSPEIQKQDFVDLCGTVSDLVSDAH